MTQEQEKHPTDTTATPAPEAMTPGNIDFDGIVGSLIDAYTLAPNDEDEKRDSVASCLLLHIPHIREADSELARLRRDVSRLRKANEVINMWWYPAGFRPPFTPGYLSGNNDGKVRDATGLTVVDCGGNEARADVVAAALTLAAPATSER